MRCSSSNRGDAVVPAGIMTRLYDDPATFTEDMLAGLLDIHRNRVSGVPAVGGRHPFRYNG